MNEFNPALPETRLLVVFGIEALANWFPDDQTRNSYNISGNLNVEQKAQSMADAGYLTALVSSDVITAGKLKIGEDGKPVMNGHRFDAVVYLYPQYAKESALGFLEEFLAKGGKLMLEGRATHDFSGNDIRSRFNKIAGMATAKEFSVEQLSSMGIQPNRNDRYCKNQDGSVTFSDWDAFDAQTETTFTLNEGSTSLELKCNGFGVVRLSSSGALEKLVAYGLKSLKMNGSELLLLDQPSDIRINRINGKYQLSDMKPDATILVDKLLNSM